MMADKPTATPVNNAPIIRVSDSTRNTVATGNSMPLNHVNNVTSHMESHTPCCRISTSISIFVNSRFVSSNPCKT